MQTNIIDYFHQTGAFYQPYLQGGLSRSCQTSQSKARRNVSFRNKPYQLDRPMPTRNDTEAISLIQDSKFKERLLNQMKYSNNLRPSLYRHNTSLHQETQQSNARQLSLTQHQVKAQRVLKYQTDQQDIDNKISKRKRQRKILEKQIIAEKTKMHLEKMREIASVLRRQKERFQQEIREREHTQVARNQAKQLKQVRSISCEHHQKQEESVNELQQKKILEQVIRRNSFLRQTLDEIEEDEVPLLPPAKPSYENKIQVVGLSKRMLENSFVNYSQRKQSEEKLQQYLDKYKMSHRTKQYSQFQPLYKLDPAIQPPVALQLHRRKRLASGMKRSFFGNSFELKGWKTDSTTQLQ